MGQNVNPIEINEAREKALDGETNAMQWFARQLPIMVFFTASIYCMFFTFTSTQTG